MILILAANSLTSLVRTANRPNPRAGARAIQLADLPAYAREQLGFNGIAMSTNLLQGADRSSIETFRDVADRARCSCIFLEESDPQPLAGRAGEKAVERLGAVLQATSLLGGSAAAFRLDAPADDETALDRVVDRTRRVLDIAERLGVNLLFRPHDGLTADPDRLTDLIKRVGGFRLGTLPDFQTAARAPDPALYLRRITPYAAAMLGSTEQFAFPPTNPDGTEIDLTAPEFEVAVTQAVTEEPPEHDAYDLAKLVAAVNAVGFDQAVAVDYRGGDDPRVGLIQSRVALEQAIERVKASESGGAKPPAPSAMNTEE